MDINPWKRFQIYVLIISLWKNMGNIKLITDIDIILQNIYLALLLYIYKLNIAFMH